ncbi:MAG: HAD-IIIC family phosphatase, partial [Planctomycetes bacterium]|nr:HAD-IIIC family phosphatase [Planctomycetota bacterium]
SDDSPLFAFEPQVVVLVLDHHAVKERLSDAATWDDLDRAARQESDRLRSLWDAIRTRCSATIVQTNFALPVERSLGHLSVKIPSSLTSLLRETNRLISREAPADVSIIDVEQLSSDVGKRVWFDSATWYTSRQSCGFAALPILAQGIAQVITGARGKSKKCLVLDLDNTLWGGVIGDAGVSGIHLGMGDALGEPFVDFQKYCLELKRRGILLAVCSKNEIENARLPFESHPDMVLKLDDFSAFVANWQDKASNLKEIAQQLNVGLDSLVFVDDNPAERQIVRTYAPEVAVPEMPEDPALYVRMLDRAGYFEVAVISEDDRQRVDFYAAEKRRRDAASVAVNMQDYLKSLEQECTTGCFDDPSLARIHQLLNKTNQWNLTTRRFTEAQIRELAIDPTVCAFWVRSKDRFGDNGLVAAVISRFADQTLVIEDWVMSCRVFQRGIEDLTFNELLAVARRFGATEIRGRYSETAKNKLVADWYGRLGFEKVPSDTEGTSDWRLRVTDNVAPRPHDIVHTSQLTNKEVTHVTRAA